MDWLQRLDTALFHWVNPAWKCSFLDAVMPFFSDNPIFTPALFVACVLLAWKGGARGRICVVLLVASIALGDGLVSNTLKNLIARPRPCLVVADAHVPEGIGCTESGSLPSSHAVNWFAATVVMFIFYRRSIRFMLPLALTVSFSRIYNGVHYPGDVLAGALVGIGSASAIASAAQFLWQGIGKRWYPLWWQNFPSLLNPIPVTTATSPPDTTQLDRHWLRLGYSFIFLLLVANLLYIASGKIGLSEDEAYQWVWSKHLALSYYSKPPMIAYTQFLGTSMWGDNVLGVRFFAPVLSAVMSLAAFRFLSRAVNVRAAFWAILLIPAVPLMAVGSVLMTIDPLSVTFWTLAMVAGWRAVQSDSTVKDWAWVGLWMGLGLLSKYTGLFQLLSWLTFFALWQPARIHLRRPGPYVALAINLLCGLPIVIWNWQHDWITVDHVAGSSGLTQTWDFLSWKLLKNPAEFIGIQTAAQNPFFFLPMLWAAFSFWKRDYKKPLMMYFFSMGAPIVLVYFLLSFRRSILANWIAPSILPLFCLAVVYWEQRWREGFRPIKYWAFGGLALGFFVTVLMHYDVLIVRLTSKPIPANLNLWRRVDGWEETAAAVEAARQKLLLEGKPVFIIGGHYGITSQIMFNLPEARENVRGQPLVYYMTSVAPVNQYYFWPGYKDRKGQNAIYVHTLSITDPRPTPMPPLMLAEFESVTPLDFKIISHGGAQLRYLQMWECRGLR